MKTILVIDDELSAAEVLAMILDEEGYRTYCAVNGQTGLERAREIRPDLLVLDYMMPVMDGGQVGQAVRADPTLRHTRILMNSGLSEAVVRDRFRDYDAFLRKPYSVDVGLRIIRELLTPR